MGARIFVSHAREDLAVAREVHRWLAETGHQAVLAQDLGAGNAVGQAWQQRLAELLRADAVVCVVTSSSVASIWCTAEVATAQSQGKRVLPLRAEPEVDHPLLADVQHTDLTRDPSAARAALLAALGPTDSPGDPSQADDRSPFPGLRPFEADQHGVFFGRADEIKALTELVRCPAEGTAVLVVGPSGCGKSSLVRAGLLPVVGAEPGWRALPPILPGSDPLATLAQELAAAGRRIGLDWTGPYVRQQFEVRGLVGLADELLLTDPDGPQQRLLMVVDQFEELLTHTQPDQRARFAELVSRAVTGPVAVVGTLRPEFLDQLLADTNLAALRTEIFAVRPLHREALRLVIERPARLAGLDVAADLVDRLVADTGSGEALPLLAFTLAQLAAGISRGGQLSAERYAQLGGVQGALIRQADAALAEAVEAGGRSREEVIAGLLRLVTVDEQGRPTRWRVRREDLPAAVATELDAFVARRLVTTDRGHDTVVIGIAHEAFLSAWPPLAQAITRNVTALRARRAVEHAAAEWHTNDRPPSRLWSGDHLATAAAHTGARICVDRAAPLTQRSSSRSPARWLHRRPRVLVTDRVDLSAPARDFLRASIRRDRRRRRRTVTVLSVLLILALTAAGVAATQRRMAQDQQRIATAGQLLGQAEATRSTDLHAALLLGLAAHRLHPSGETHAGLVNTLVSGPYLRTLTGHTGSVRAIAFTPDGHTMATGSADNTVLLWDLANPSRPQRLASPLRGHSKPVNALVFAPDGDILATGSADNTVILWDLTDRERPRRIGPALTGHTGPVTSMVLTPDGHTLATGSDDATAILWDLTDRLRPRRIEPALTGHTGPVTSMAATPDSRTLVTGSADHTVIVWDLTDRLQPRQLGSPLTLPRIPSPYRLDISLALAPDGGTLATTGADGNVLLWDLTDRASPRQLGPPLRDATDSIDAVAFAPTGRMLATSSSLGTMLWDLSDPAQPSLLRAPLVGHSSTVNAVAFAPDGDTLVVGSNDGSVILWDLTVSVQPRPLGLPLTGDRNPVWSAALAPDGRTLATGSDNGTVILWDLSDPTRPRPLGSPLAGHSGWVWSVAFAPDGRTLATGSADGTVILWNVADRAAPHQLGPQLVDPTMSVVSVAFAPDGHTLATGSDNGTVILWDLTDPAQPHQLGSSLTGHTGIVRPVAFAPDGHTLATGSAEGTVILWEVSDPAQPRRLGSPLTGHTSVVLSVAFAPDGRTLATSSVDGTGILWDLTHPTQPRRWGPPLVSNSLGVWSVAFAPDGRTLATSSIDVTLWDVTDPASSHQLGPSLRNDLAGDLTDVRFVAFAPHGATLVTGKGNGTVDLWDLTDLSQVRDHAVERACLITGGLSRDEWHHHVPDLPYQDTCPDTG